MEQAVLPIQNELRGCIVIFQPTFDPSTDKQSRELNEHIRVLMDQYTRYIEDVLENKVKYEYDTLFHGLAVEFSNLDKICETIRKSPGVQYLDIDNNKFVELQIQKLLQDYKRAELAKYGIDFIYQSDTPVSIADSL